MRSSRKQSNERRESATQTCRPGLELALRRQRAGTRAVIQAEWRFAYGEDGRPASSMDGTKAVEPRTDVTWRLSTLSLGRGEGESEGRDKLNELREKKDLGNNHFRHSNWRKAAQNYQDVLKDLNPEAYDECRDEPSRACGPGREQFGVCAHEIRRLAQGGAGGLRRAGVAPDDEKALYRAAKIALHLRRSGPRPTRRSRRSLLIPRVTGLPPAGIGSQNAAGERAEGKQMSRSMAGALLLSTGRLMRRPPQRFRGDPVLGGCVVAVAVAVAAAL